MIHSPPDGASTPARLLVVEDDPAIAELLSWHLSRAGHRVTETGNGEEAVLLARDEHPDLVVLDWMIERMSGLEVCRLLRDLPQTRDIPIIMLTARAEEADRLAGLRSGADDFMTKPFSPQELVARIDAVLRRAAAPPAADPAA